MIRKNGNKYEIISHEGKSLGSYDTEAEAQKRLGQIEYFKTHSRQTGGSITANQSYLVGENGPEVVVPKTNGTVIPNKKDQQILSGRDRGMEFGFTDAMTSGIAFGFDDNIAGAARASSDGLLSVFTGEPFSLQTSYRQGKAQQELDKAQYMREHPIMGNIAETGGFIFSAGKFMKYGRAVLGLTGAVGGGAAAGALNAAGNDQSPARGAALGALMPVLGPTIKGGGSLLNLSGKFTSKMIDNAAKIVVGKVIQAGGGSASAMESIIEKGGAKILMKFLPRVGIAAGAHSMLGIPGLAVGGSGILLRTAGQATMKASDPIAQAIIKEMTEIEPTFAERTLLLNLFGIDDSEESVAKPADKSTE